MCGLRPAGATLSPLSDAPASADRTRTETESEARAGAAEAAPLSAAGPGDFPGRSRPPAPPPEPFPYFPGPQAPPLPPDQNTCRIPPCPITPQPGFDYATPLSAHWPAVLEPRADWLVGIRPRPGGGAVYFGLPPRSAPAAAPSAVAPPLPHREG